MHWKDLLSLKRQGDTKKRLRTDQNNLRSGFEVDYDGLFSLRPFGTYKTKPKLFPFHSLVLFHTRLTHSLEVSVVGRSLGRAVGNAVIQKHPALAVTHGYHQHDFGTIVAAACLAHDIGNPLLDIRANKPSAIFLLLELAQL